MIIYSNPKSQNDINEMHQLRYQVYNKVGYIPDNNLEVDIDDYDNHSIHFIGKINEKIVGSIRLIRCSETGFPIEENFNINIPGIFQKNRDKVVEISRLVVDSNLKFNVSRDVMLGLLKTAYDYSVRNGYINWYLAVDYRIFRILSGLGVTMTVIGDPKKYLGSKTIPACIMNVRLCAENMYELNGSLARFFNNCYSNEEYGWYIFEK